MTWDQVAAVALKVGWTPGQAVIATAITGQESSRYPQIIQQGQPYATTGWGLWQITPGDSVPQFGINYALLNPVNNGKAAYWKFTQANGWDPWYADLFGRYQVFLPWAEPAVERVTHLSKAQLDRLVADAQRGTGGEPTGSTQLSDWSPQVRDAGRHTGRAAARLVELGELVHGLHARVAPPPVTVPAAGGLLWEPGEPWPVAD